MVLPRTSTVKASPERVSRPLRGVVTALTADAFLVGGAALVLAPQLYGKHQLCNHLVVVCKPDWLLL
jgi:hypothetical protein